MLASSDANISAAAFYVSWIHPTETHWNLVFVSCVELVEKHVDSDHQDPSGDHRCLLQILWQFIQ